MSAMVYGYRALSARAFAMVASVATGSTGAGCAGCGAVAAPELGALLHEATWLSIKAMTAARRLCCIILYYIVVTPYAERTLGAAAESRARLSPRNHGKLPRALLPLTV